MPKLVQIQGNWINPETVAHVRQWETEFGDSGIELRPGRIDIYLIGGWQLKLKAHDNQTLKDILAKLEA